MSDFIDKESRDLERLIFSFYVAANRQAVNRVNGLRKRIREYIQSLTEDELKLAKRKIRQRDVDFFNRLFEGFEGFDPSRKVMNGIRSEYKTIFEAGANGAARTLGFNATVKLTNEVLLRGLEERSGTFPASSRHSFEQAKSTIRKHFIEQGEAPYNSRFVNQLMKDLNIKARWDAKRFARTETGVIGSGAQSEMFKRSGVERKSWANLGDARPWHQNVMGANGDPIIPMDEPFNVDGEMLMHPHDSSGSPRNVINCRCSLVPHVSEEIEEVWDGR